MRQTQTLAQTIHGTTIQPVDPAPLVILLELTTVLRTCCRVLSMTLWYSSVHPILIRSIYSTINQVSSNNIIILSFEIEFEIVLFDFVDVDCRTEELLTTRYSAQVGARSGGSNCFSGTHAHGHATAFQFSNTNTTNQAASRNSELQHKHHE